MDFGDNDNKSEPRLVFVALTAVISAFIGGLMALVGMLLFGAYPVLSKTTDFSAVTQFFYDWQTLVGAILAVSAAGITVWAIREQTRTVERQNVIDRVASQRVAMTALPAALSNVFAYTEVHWAKMAALARKSIIGPRPILNEKDFPKIEDSTLIHIREVVRYTPIGEDRVSNLIITLARQIQYHEARIREAPQDTHGLTTRAAENHLEAIAEINAIASELLSSFSENYVTNVVAEGAVLQAATKLNFTVKTYEGLQMLEKRLARRASLKAGEDYFD